MKNKVKIAVLGADLRQSVVAERIGATGAEVCAWGLLSEAHEKNGVSVCEEMEEAIRDAKAVILPLPISSDGKTLNCVGKREGEAPTLLNVLDNIKSGAIVLGGRIPNSFALKALEREVETIDYYRSEKLQIRNAYVTAEAAVSIAMNSLNKCLRDARIAVTGSGRISRFLCDLLRRMGASVCVAARNEDALVYFEQLGCGTVLIRQDDDGRWSDALLKGNDMIFNTVPVWLFGRSFLERVDKGTVLVELASAPGGIDVCAARELGSNVLWAASLPGKYAPQSAGELVADAIKEILFEREVLKI